MFALYVAFFFFFFNDTATTEIYTLSLHDALPISRAHPLAAPDEIPAMTEVPELPAAADARLIERDRKSTRLNSSHSQISYAVFCLKKKKKTISIKHAFITSSHEQWYRSYAPRTLH